MSEQSRVPNGAVDAEEVDAHPGRRRFLKWLIRLGYGAFALAFALPALALRALSQAKETIEPGDVLVYAMGDRAGLPVQADQVEPGTAVQAFPEGKTDNQNNLIAIIRLGPSAAPTDLVAYSAICTHLGCTVLPRLSDDGYIVCPCHASFFDPSEGARVVSGPATRPLHALPITVGPEGTIVATSSFLGDVGPK